MNAEQKEEIRIINKLMNSKLAVAIASVLIAGPTTWLLAGATFSQKVDTVIEQNKMNSYEDSLQNTYLQERNAHLLEALDRSNKSINRLDTTVNLLNYQIHDLKEDVEYIRNRIDKQQR